MSQGWLTFAGVILGAVIAGGVSVWREQVVTTRERAAKQAERDQLRKDVRDAFQRESLLALQEAVEASRRAMVAQFIRARGASRKSRSWQRPRKSPSWQRPRVGDSRYEAWRDKDVSVKELSARVFDAEVRRLVQRFRGASSAAVFASEEQEAARHVNSANNLAGQVNDRIAELLPELY
jgi:HAMP domain-containing protein